MKKKQHDTSKSQKPHNKLFDDREVDKISHIELKIMMIRMINEIKEDIYKFLNSFKENINKKLNE
jgi:hypothetical protein